MGRFGLKERWVTAMTTQEILIAASPRTQIAESSTSERTRPGGAAGALSQRLAAAAMAGLAQVIPLSKRLGLSIWSALEAAGHRRAGRELRRIAAQWEHFDPELARKLTDASYHHPTR